MWTLATDIYELEIKTEKFFKNVTVSKNIIINSVHVNIVIFHIKDLIF